jgi:hypothetical protein
VSAVDGLHLQNRKWAAFLSAIWSSFLNCKMKGWNMAKSLRDGNLYQSKYIDAFQTNMYRFVYFIGKSTRSFA